MFNSTIIKALVDNAVNPNDKYRDVVLGPHTSDTIRRAMEVAQQEREEEASKALSQVLKDLMNRMTEHKQFVISDIRLMKLQLKASKAKLVDVDRAFDYFTQTGNPLPLMKLLGILGRYYSGVDQSQYEQATVVPKNWTQTVELTKADEVVED